MDFYMECNTGLKCVQEPIIIPSKIHVRFSLPIVNVPILYPQKIPENPWLPDVFRSYKIAALARNVLSSKE